MTVSAMCVSTCRGQKAASDSRQLELCMEGWEPPDMGSELRSSGRTASALHLQPPKLILLTCTQALLAPAGTGSACDNSYGERGQEAAGPEGHP